MIAGTQDDRQAYDNQLDAQLRSQLAGCDLGCLS
jgi:hypothetical protein